MKMIVSWNENLLETPRYRGKNVEGWIEAWYPPYIWSSQWPRERHTPYVLSSFSSTPIITPLFCVCVCVCVSFSRVSKGRLGEIGSRWHFVPHAHARTHSFCTKQKKTTFVQPHLTTWIFWPTSKKNEDCARSWKKWNLHDLTTDTIWTKKIDILNFFSFQCFAYFFKQLFNVFQQCPPELSIFICGIGSFFGS